MTYTYNLGGAPVDQQYPSGRVVKNVLDANGDLANVKSKKVGAAPYRTYANNFTYNAAGAVTSMELGNLNWESTVFNSRLQPTQIALGRTASATDLLKLDYGYGTTANNGNVLSQTMVVPGMTHPLIQAYTYDSLNRLESATETSNSSETWKQEFSYNRYGNRNFVTGTGHTTTLGSCTTMCNPTFNTTTNRITSSGYTYDSSGNTTADPSGRSFVYDAENKQASVSNGSGTVGQYYYDGDGERVKKIVPSTGETTIFVYDASGKSIAEYSTIVANPTEAKVNYLTADYLGSPRANTDATGTIIARHDYHPFGEEIAPTGSRSTTGYNGDTVRKQFTGYERDIENGMDYANARYFNSSLGRFTIPDDFVNDSQISDAQSWNLYVTCRNNPVNCVDPSGKEAVVTITIDENTKKGKIVVAATIGIWTKDKNISQKDMDRAAKKIQTSIQNAWKGAMEKDGITYEVSTVVSVRSYKDAAEAEKYGAGNIIEMSNGPIGPGDTDSNAGSGGFFTGYDVGRWNIKSVMNGTTAEHEFGHLMGVDNKPGNVLMNTNPNERNGSMTPPDFDWTFGNEVTRQRYDSRFSTVREPTERGYRNQQVDSGRPRSSNKNYTFSAPRWGWWKSE